MRVGSGAPCSGPRSPIPGATVSGEAAATPPSQGPDEASPGTMIDVATGVAGTGRLRLPGGRSLDLSGPPLVMAIVNCNGDSFFAPSRVSGDAAVERALAAEAAGAAMVDIGGESSRPGSAYVDADEELRRVVPVVAGIRRRSSIPISVDTRKAVVARAALDAGADIINDISALRDDPALGPLCAERGCGVVLMHMKGDPATMQDAPSYADAVVEVRSFLAESVRRALAYGIAGDSIMVDPGVGFGKRYGDNLELLARLAEIVGDGYPVLVGLSRKSFLGTATGRSVAERLSATLAADVLAVASGARVIRVHDVAEHADAVAVAAAVLAHRRPDHGAARTGGKPDGMVPEASGLL